MGILTDPPKFVDYDTDLHLQADSPGIDAASDHTTACLEQAPNGCKTNLGAYGGTTTGSPSVATAEHCDCEP